MKTFNGQSKNAIIIGCYPDTKDKIEILEKCILSLESLNYDKILVSHYPVPESLQLLVDFYIYDKKNYLLDYDQSYYILKNENIRVQFLLESPGNHSVAVLRNHYSGFSLCKDYGYEYVMYIEGDAIFDKGDINKVDDVINDLNLRNKKGYMEGFGGMGWEMEGLDFIDVAFKLSCFIVKPEFWLDNINCNITPEEFLEYHQDKNLQFISIERFVYQQLENKLNEIDFVINKPDSEFYSDSKFKMFPLSEMNWSRNNENPLCKILLDNKTNENYFFICNDSLTNDVNIKFEAYYDNDEKEQVDIFLNKKDKGAATVVNFRLHKFNIKYNLVQVIATKNGEEEPFYTEKYNSSDLKYSDSTIEWF